MAILPQGLLPFQYCEETKSSGLTGLAGLGGYLDLAEAAGMWRSIARHVQVRSGDQGWTDSQVIGSLILLQLAGGESIEDLDRLEADEGFCELWKRVDPATRGKRGRSKSEARFRKGRQRAVPSQSAAFRYLGEFADGQDLPRPEAKAYIPKANEALEGLARVCSDLVAFAQRHRPSSVATLDLDATLIETNKREASWCYQGYRAYQPLQVWWAEQQAMVYTEFRDGNVPAGFENLRVLKEALELLPAGVEQVRLRSDSAAYQHDLLGFCDDGKSAYGRIDFAVSCPISPEFKQAVAQVEESAWQDLDKEHKGQEWAEVCFVPNAIAGSKQGREYRYLAIREPLRQLDLPGVEPSPVDCPTLRAHGVRYKLSALVTNLKDVPGEDVIAWYRERCGKSEEAHSILKEDLAGGRLPSGSFGVNAAWWWITVLALNLHNLMKILVLGEAWIARRLKTLRFRLICLPGRVVQHARQLFVRLSRGHPALQLLIAARQRIQALAAAT